MRGRLARGWSALGVLLMAGACTKAKQEAPKPVVETTSAAAEPQLKPVKVALDWVAEPEFGGFYAARERGFFKQHGLDVTLQGGGAGVPVMQMVASGQADFGTTSADEVITARARGVDVLAVYAVYQTSPRALMSHTARGDKSLQDLFSKGTVAMEPGTPYAAFLKKKFGFDKVKVVPYDGGVARFVADKDFAQQCFVTSEPIAARRLGSDPAVFLVSDAGFNPYATVVFTRGALWKEQPARVREFVAAAREGWRVYLDDASATNAVMGKINTSMDAETFAASSKAQAPFIETDETRARGLGTMSRERWETLGQQLVELGLIDKAPAVDDFVWPEALAPATK
jgi:NitT/TauT family transport system substrate-binding protein